MDYNCISKAVIQQINPPNRNSADIMEEIITQNERLYTFGAIPPFDESIDRKIKQYMNLHIKGWKINPQDTTFILAHSGCFEFVKMVDLLKNHHNVYTDISIQPTEHIKTLINEIGHERILFGTDYPLVTQAFSILSVLRAIKNESERTFIFSKNAKRLLRD